jgi:hypothetical protein
MTNTKGLLSLVVLSAFVTCGCGSHPTDLASDRDIRRTSKDVEMIRVGLLPLEDYPELVRFQQVRDVDFFTMDGTGADDARLEALANLNWKKLKQVCLLNCPSVTDEGIRHLSRLSSLEGFQLEGTSITDESLEILASNVNLKGINIANCPKITREGLLRLADHEGLEELGFSVGSMTHEDVVQIVTKLKDMEYLGIVDPDGKIREEELDRLGEEKGIAISVITTGALQDVGSSSQ